MKIVLLMVKRKTVIGKMKKVTLRVLIFAVFIFASRKKIAFREY